MTENSIEISRKNVSVAEFFGYINRQCQKKGMEFHITQHDFEKPYREELSSYMVINGKKKCYNEEYRTVTKRYRKIASNGGFLFFYTDQFEEYEEKELHRIESEWDGADAPAQAETTRTFAYDYQVYILNHDGTCYNEICEFTFDSENRGYGYYFQLNKM
jgi:hypothetical protein